MKYNRTKDAIHQLLTGAGLLLLLLLLDILGRWLT